MSDGKVDIPSAQKIHNIAIAKRHEKYDIANLTRIIVSNITEEAAKGGLITSTQLELKKDDVSATIKILEENFVKEGYRVDVSIIHFGSAVTTIQFRTIW